jgi:flagellar biosynthesis/type III secretory pathway chaperone
MDATELKNLLQRLKGELESGQPVAPELRQLLQTLDQDIQQALQSPAETTSEKPKAPSDDEASLNERAQVIEARFAADHPYLASTLRDVLDTLGKMGI